MRVFCHMGMSYHISAFLELLNHLMDIESERVALLQCLFSTTNGLCKSPNITRCWSCRGYHLWIYFVDSCEPSYARARLCRFFFERLDFYVVMASLLGAPGLTTRSKDATSNKFKHLFLFMASFRSFRLFCVFDVFLFAPKCTQKRFHRVWSVGFKSYFDQQSHPRQCIFGAACSTILVPLFSLTCK